MPEIANSKYDGSKGKVQPVSAGLFVSFSDKNIPGINLMPLLLLFLTLSCLIHHFLTIITVVVVAAAGNDIAFDLLFKEKCPEPKLIFAFVPAINNGCAQNHNVTVL